MGYVGVGRRAAAVIIDALILMVITGVLSVVIDSGLLGLVLAVLGVLYFIGMEATTGQTIGKMAMGIRVVTVDGSPIGWGPSIIRNLLRIVDGLFVYLVGAVFIWMSPRKQRLGDKAAGTVVVRAGTETRAVPV